MFRRQTSGSVLCVSCGYLVGVNDEKCYHCGRRNPGLWGFAPALRALGQDLGFVPFVTGTCVVLYGLMLLLSGPAVLRGGMTGFLAPSLYTLMMFGAAGSYPVFELGRWWTVLSAGWLHAGLLHILFNVLWIRQLAPAVGEMYGPGRMVIIYTIASVAGFTASSAAGEFLSFLPLRVLQGAPFTVGASAPIFGLLGALVYYGRRAGSSMASSQAWTWAVWMFVFGLIMPGIDNYAHAGGFVGGYVAGQWLDPLKPERINHMLWAVICLGLSLAAILVSIGHAISLS
ncbi:MAG: rhomboid family intramembrane serine protease [Acidobacteria bacterium]|nr:rhomboid family intramembrane serine protease [Acidobacteriota bacterium]